MLGGLLLAPAAAQAAQPVEALMAAMEGDMTQGVTSSINSGVDANMFDGRWIR